MNKNFEEDDIVQEKLGEDIPLVQVFPVRRVYIPKPGKSEKKLIGVPTILDRALQHIVSKVLNVIYE